MKSSLYERARMSEIDEIDLRLLRLLSENADRSAGALAKALEMSHPAIWRRIKRLEESGVIKGYRWILNREKLGLGVTVFLGVKLSGKRGVPIDDFERAVSAIPEVQTVEHVLGMYDYRLRVVARDIADFERILRRRIMSLPGAGDVEANVLSSEERLLGPLLPL